MSDFYDDLMKNWDETEESHGYAGDPLPTGWYFLELERVIESGLTRNGAPQARVQLRVMEGDQKDARAFVGVVMGASAMNADGSARSDSDKLSANRNILAMMKGLLKALGVQTGQPVGEFPDKVFNFYNLGAWPGSKFVGKISVQQSPVYGASNRLNAYHAVDDPKKGLAWLRAQSSGRAAPRQPQATEV